MNSSRVLLVTNDFPPKVGGIQSYIRDLCGAIEPERLIVLTSTPRHEDWQEHDSQVDYTVIRLPQAVLLPTPAVARTMAQLIDKHSIDIVWFGAAAPLALLGKRAHQAGAQRVIASTHGHEVGWSMIPGSRQLLRLIGNRVDVVTYVSAYAMGRISRALGPHPTRVRLSPGVDIERFHPDDALRTQIRARYGLDDQLVITCISRIVRRKGQDQLVEVMPEIIRHHPQAHLMIVGPGALGTELHDRAVELGVSDHVTLTGPVDAEELPAYYAAADIFAMPVRTRGAGLDVEGFGIVFIEAQACGLPTIAGDGGGAPETILPGAGLVVDGRRRPTLIRALDRLLSDDHYRQAMGQRAREVAEEHWSTRQLHERFARLCSLDLSAVSHTDASTARGRRALGDWGKRHEGR